MEPQPLPVWVKAEDGEYVNLALMHGLLVSRMDGTDIDIKDADPCTDFCVVATSDLADYTLARCQDAETAQAALDRLVSLLPIAIVDMDLDVIAPVERKARQEAQESA